MKNVNFLLGIAIFLAIIWIIASVTRFIAGALLNMFLVVAVVLFVIWLVRRIM